ncbi:MAG: hypothetical protein KAG19_07490 [Methylococcales bacterium]|nr:hypothetical protein [Methylococcales bacterium]
MSKQPDMIEALNFADSFTLAMDDEIRRDGLAGSYGCFALELESIPDVIELQQRVAEFASRFPTSTAHLQQKGRRFYWVKRAQAPQLFFHHIAEEGHDSKAFQQQTIQQIINEKQERDQVTPIEFHLINQPNQSIFLMRWIHPFCDAGGANLILQYLYSDDDNQRKKLGKPAVKALVSTQLAKYSWWKKISLFFKAKRYIDTLDHLKSIQPFVKDQAPSTSVPNLHYTVKRLTTEQTTQVVKQARKHVGLTGTSLYYIGCLMRALDKLHPETQGDAYCTPYAFNLRKQRALTPVTGNHISALFAQVPRKIIQNREKLFTHLKQQNMDVIRQQLDYAFLPLMWAGSWLSLEEYGKILRLSHGKDGERSSFWFSDIGKLEIPNDHFIGANIKAVFHICQVSTPPALAFLSCIYKNQLTLSYNFIQPMISKNDIDKLHTLVLAELLSE